MNALLTIKKEDTLEGLNYLRKDLIFAKIFPVGSCGNCSELHIAVNESDLKKAMKILENNNIEVSEHKTCKENVIGIFYEKTGR
ncbi:MAG: hypothetical protein R6U52_10775 [Kosmotogaceae bacterium]